MFQKTVNNEHQMPPPIQNMQQQHQNYSQHVQDYSTFKNNSTLQVTQNGIHQTPSNYVDMVTPSYANTQTTDPIQYQLNSTGFQSGYFPKQYQQQYQQQYQVFNVPFTQTKSTAPSYPPLGSYGQQQQAPMTLKQKQATGIPQNFLVSCSCNSFHSLIQTGSICEIK